MFRAKLRTLVCKPPVNCSVTHKPLDNKNNGTCYDCYQFVIKRLIEIAETRINTGFFKQLDLFKLNRPRWFARQVVEYSIYSSYLVYDSAHDCLEHLEWYLCRFGGHEVDGVDCTECNGVVVGALVTHDADAPHVGQRSKILAGALGHGQLVHFLAPDGIGILHDGNLFGGHIADDADG